MLGWCEMLGRMRIVSANVNGIRAAARRGGLRELADCHADVIALQEVRASQRLAAGVVADSELHEYQMVHDEGARAGHAGVALLLAPRVTFAPTGGGDGFEPGRWLAGEVRADDAAPTGSEGLQLANTYVPTGAGGGPAAAGKDRFLADIGGWLADQQERPAVLVGDLNVAHKSQDIRNWRGNLGKPGFLPDERAHLDRWLAPRPTGLGWTDVGRAMAGPVDGPYTWWSWRGRAFDNDSGWRIDYALVSPPLAGAIEQWEVLRAASYDQRWSDHAAVVLEVALPG